MPEYNVEIEVHIIEVVNIVADSPEEAEKIASEKGWYALSNGRGNWNIIKSYETVIEEVNKPDA